MLYEHELVRKGLARWYRGRLIPIMQGASGDEPLFELPPKDFAALDDAELAALAAGLRDRFGTVYEGREDPEIVGNLSRTDVADQMQEAVLAIEAIDAEIADRAKEAEGYVSKTDELAARAGVKKTEDPPPDDEPEPEDPEGETKGEQLAAKDDEEEEPAKAKTASASAVRTTRRPLPAARRHAPVQHDDDGRGLRVTSHASGLGVPYHAQALLDRGMIGEFLTDIVRKNRVQPGQKAVLAHASYAFPSDRILSDGPDSHLTNSLKIRDAINPQTTNVEAMVASGANCAPLPAVYELPGVETAARPVRAALPSFQAARGGVQLGATPTMGTYAGATDVVPAAENELGGTHAVKNCMRIECPDFTAIPVDSLYQCIEADNLAARAYPELMSRIADLVNAEQARLADARLLSTIKAGSTNVTHGAETPGATYWLIASILQSAAGIRSRNRMPDGASMQALLPVWTIDVLMQDIARATGDADRFKTRAQIEAILRNAGIIPAFYLDGPSTGDGQVFGTQSAGALLGYPDTLQWAIFPTGTWLHLDSGELQLGVVRDSTLNSTNDFQVFAETWEQVGKVGVESLWVTTNICANGTFAAAATAEVCT